MTIFARNAQGEFYKKALSALKSQMLLAIGRYHNPIFCHANTLRMLCGVDNFIYHDNNPAVKLYP